MEGGDYQDLPMLVGEQYMLFAVLRETRDTILYRGTQRELQREVMVESLRHSAMDVPRKVNLFLNSAKAQAGFSGEHLSRVLEVMQANGTWMVARESPTGEPLDMVQSNGHYITARDMCQLMILLCKLCLRMDAEDVASARFLLEDIYYSEHDFHLSNPARAGARMASDTRCYLAEAGRKLVPMLDHDSEMARPVREVLQRFAVRRDDSLLHTANLLAELSRLHTLILTAQPVIR